MIYDGSYKRKLFVQNGGKYMNYKKMIIEAIEKVKDEKILKKIYYFVIRILDQDYLVLFIF